MKYISVATMQLLQNADSKEMRGFMKRLAALYEFTNISPGLREGEGRGGKGKVSKRNARA